MNLKLASVLATVAVVAVAAPLRAVTGAAATDGPPGTSDGSFDGSNPYAVITDRNIFHLNPPPPPVSDADKKAKEVPKVFLNGIVSVGDDVRVLFSIPPKDNKSQTAYFKLGLGERDDVLELVRIHPNRQEVDVLVNGTPVTLSMLSNSLAAAPGGKAAPAAAPSPPGGPRGRQTAAAAAPEGSSAIIAGKSRDSSPYGNVAVAGGGGVATIGGGTSSSFGGGGGGVTVSGGGGGSFGSASGAGTSFGGGGGSVPSSYAGTTSTGTGVTVSGGTSAQIANALFSGTQAQTAYTPSPAPATPVLSEEQQVANMLIKYQAATSQGQSFPPLPPPVMHAGEEAGMSFPDLPPTP
jgi:hypothetical protein